MSSLHVLLATVTAIAACIVTLSAAQGTTGGGAGVPSCASKLVPCGGYLNSTAPPSASCCGPLREAAANETACLCTILTDKALLQAFHVDPAQGLLLAKRCGVATDATACSKSGTGNGVQRSNRKWSISATPQYFDCSIEKI